MTKIVAIHSFRGGTGKSNVTANLAGQLAAAGKRVCVIDTDIQSPGIHVLFGFMEGDLPKQTLNDFLYGGVAISEVSTDVSSRLPFPVAGSLELVASSIAPADISEILRNGYDVERLNDALVQLGSARHLDFLLIDTHPGLNEETLLTTAICDILIVIMRPDNQDYQGTAVTLDVAARLGVPERLIVVNKVYEAIEPSVVIARVEQAYGLPVVAALPLSQPVASNASSGLFSLTSPEHPWSLGVKRLADRLAAAT
ncbi:MAG: MinD/ParA family protein [Candidatus Nanopelagicales bacterium]|nr:MinD/ParA family protein [Candidatus Nanopelagicales bacterium]